MRHAESTQNTKDNSIRNYCSDKLVSWKEEERMLRSLKTSLDPEILNAKLSEEGIKQAKKHQNKSYLKKIKCVVLSPLRRCIETFENMFENHPNFFSGGIKIFLVEEGFFY